MNILNNKKLCQRYIKSDLSCGTCLFKCLLSTKRNQIWAKKQVGYSFIQYECHTRLDLWCRASGLMFYMNVIQDESKIVCHVLTYLWLILGEIK